MIDLPDYPASRDLVWEPIEFGSVQRGALGGAAQRINRLGDRLSLTVTLPPMKMDVALEWQAALTRANREGARYWFRQPDVSPGGAGAPLVDGADQAGSTLVLRGLTPGYVIGFAQKFAIVTASQRYVYECSAPSMADVSGNIAISLTQPLRVAHGDGDEVELAKPKIEGLLVEAPEFRIPVNRIMAGLTFTIEEAR